MAAAYALSALFHAGLSARIEGDQLLVQPVERLTGALRRLIREHKSELMDALRGEAANGPQTYRRWSIRDPGGKTWDVTCCPPATAAELARSWPPGSVLTPVPDVPIQPDGPALDDDVEAGIQRWLASIGEVDPAIIGEVLDLCADDPAILAMYLGLAGDVPDELPSRDVKCCGTCARYQRIDHPRLGHCGVGEPEPLAGLWDSQARTCGKMKLAVGE